MAVDANVLIYERIREELKKGKELLQAVRAGFERAMSAILDSNITTFLVGMVLYNVGVGPVRGFAVTLMIGIITTVFTQFFVSRLLFHWALKNNKLEGWQQAAGWQPARGLASASSAPRTRPHRSRRCCGRRVAPSAST